MGVEVVAIEYRAEWLRMAGVLLATAAALPVPAEAASRVAEEPAVKMKVPEFIVIGLPSTWEHPFSFREALGAGEAWECVPFVIRSRSPRETGVLITTSGVKGARLARNAAGGEGSCSKEAAGAGILLPMSLAPDAQVEAQLIVPVESFPVTAEGGKGALMVFPKRGDPTAVELTLRRQPPPLTLQALQWLIGIVLPLLASGWLAYRFAHAQKRRERALEEQDGLKVFRDENRDRLSHFFSGLYHNVRPTEGTGASRRMQEELAEQGITAALPADDGAKVAALIRKGSWSKLDKKLGALFPEHKPLIMRDGREI